MATKAEREQLRTILDKQSTGEALSPEEEKFIFDFQVDQRRRKAVGARARETIFDMLGKGLRMYAGVPLGPGLREQREARSAAERAQAREMASQDPFVYRNMYGDKYAEYVNQLATVAQASLSDEDNEEIERAKLEVQREKDLRDFLLGGGGSVEDEDLAAQKAAARYLMGLSRGGASQQTMQQTMAGLETEYALDQYRHWMNVYLGEAERNGFVSSEEQAENRANLTEGEVAQGESANAPAGLTGGDFRIAQRSISPEADAAGTYPYIRQAKIDAGTLKPSPDRLSQEQRALIASGITPEEASRRATAALDRLESMPSLQGTMRTLALENLTPEQQREIQFAQDEAGQPVEREWTVRDTFDKVYGQTQQEAELRDLETVSEIEWAMDRMLGEGNFDPLTSNPRFLEDMRRKGYSPKEYARFLKTREALKREEGGKPQEEIKSAAQQSRALMERAAEQSARTVLTDKPTRRPFSKSAEAAGANRGGSGDAGVDSDTDQGDETPDIKVKGIKTAGAGTRGGVRQQIRTNRQEARRAKVAAEVEKRKEEREAKKAQRGDPMNLGI